MLVLFLSLLDFSDGDARIGAADRAHWLQRLQGPDGLHQIGLNSARISIYFSDDICQTFHAIEVDLIELVEGLQVRELGLLLGMLHLLLVLGDGDVPSPFLGPPACDHLDDLAFRVQDDSIGTVVGFCWEKPAKPGYEIMVLAFLDHFESWWLWSLELLINQAFFISLSLQHLSQVALSRLIIVIIPVFRGINRLFLWWRFLEEVFIPPGFLLLWLLLLLLERDIVTWNLVRPLRELYIIIGLAYVVLLCFGSLQHGPLLAFPPLLFRLCRRNLLGRCLWLLIEPWNLARPLRLIAFSLALLLVVLRIVKAWDFTWPSSVAVLFTLFTVLLHILLAFSSLQRLLLTLDPLNRLDHSLGLLRQLKLENINSDCNLLDIPLNPDKELHDLFQVSSNVLWLNVILNKYCYDV